MPLHVCINAHTHTHKVGSTHMVITCRSAGLSTQTYTDRMAHTERHNTFIKGIALWLLIIVCYTNTLLLTYLRGCCNDDEKGVWRMAEFDPRPAPPLKPHIRTASEGVIMSDKAFCFCACASSRAVVFTRRFCRFYLLNALLARVIAMCPCLSVWVCLSVTSRCSLEIGRRIELVFGTQASFDLSHSVF